MYSCFTKNLRARTRWVLATLCSLFLLSACGLGKIGDCGAYCSGKRVPREVAPPRDQTRGSILDLGGVLKDKHWVWSRATIERISELPDRPKVDPRIYLPSLPDKDVQGSQWYKVTWGTDEIDPKTKLAGKRFPIDEPSPPPGIYRLTSQVSYIGLTPGRYTPFQGKPRTTTIAVEAGKTTILSYRTGVDPSTTPITAWVDVVQLGSEEALKLMRSNPAHTIHPDLRIAEPPAHQPQPAAQAISPTSSTSDMFKALASAIGNQDAQDASAATQAYAASAQGQAFLQAGRDQNQAVAQQQAQQQAEQQRQDMAQPQQRGPVMRM